SCLWRLHFLCLLVETAVRDAPPRLLIRRPADVAVRRPCAPCSCRLCASRDAFFRARPQFLSPTARAPPLSQRSGLRVLPIATRRVLRSTTTSRSFGLSATRGCVFRTRRRKCRLWLRNGGLCHPHVGALRCASREYAAPWCDQLRSRC